MRASATARSAPAAASASSVGWRATRRRSIPAPPRSIAVSPRPATSPPTSCWSLIGDALGDAGITRSGGILQVTAATLESRRNGVVEALRNLLAPNAIDDQDTLPRAQQAVLEIYDRLEDMGSPDLRVLLDESLPLAAAR